jgi:hypothetical protein
LFMVTILILRSAIRNIRIINFNISRHPVLYYPLAALLQLTPLCHTPRQSIERRSIRQSLDWNMSCRTRLVAQAGSQKLDAVRNA